MEYQPLIERSDCQLKDNVAAINFKSAGIRSITYKSKGLDIQNFSKKKDSLSVTAKIYGKESEISVGTNNIQEKSFEKIILC